MSELLIVFVHGYSVTNLDTYGELPLRLHNEAISRGYTLQIENVYLGRYITFHDEVLLADVSRAMEHAIKTQLPPGKRFVCITHSTGGPVVRTWWKNYYQTIAKICPMSHLIMLAPANHGSALAQLGKSKLSRVKNFIEGLEPGRGILNWLELGSEESWRLNLDWVKSSQNAMTSTSVFPFVFIGQTIDRKLYDHINSYTGESGSDGVVRVAAANVNSAYLKLIQSESASADSQKTELAIAEFEEANPIPFKVIKNTAHSGDELGIMRKVKKEVNAINGLELVQGIFECIKVATPQDFQSLIQVFEKETAVNQDIEKIEIVRSAFQKKNYFHDRHAIVIFRIMDDQGNEVDDFDLILTGDNDDPDMLPSGFFNDRQCNLVHRNTLTYFFNYDIMCGTPELLDAEGNQVRAAKVGLESFGFILKARPDAGFIRYQACHISGTQDLLKKVIRPNATTLVEIVLKRLVDPENFRFEKSNGNDVNQLSFKNIAPSNDAIV